MMETQPAHKSSVTDVHARRVRALKAAFQRQLGHKPNVIERMLRDHAAVTMAKAEAAARDPSISANDFRALDSAARRARNEFEAVAKAREPTLVPLRERLAAEAEQSA